MKLKKIVSLALAGVLAVSMLAGCKSTGAADSSASSEAPAATGLTGKVIAALDVDNVTFSADATMQKILDAVMEDKGSTVTSTTLVDYMLDLYPTLGSDAMAAANKNQIPAIQGTNTNATGNDSKTQTSIFMVSSTEVNESLLVKQLANLMEKMDVYDNSNTGKTMADLPEYSLYANPQDYRYEFAYTGKVATASVTNETTGITTNYVVFSITRTPTKVDA